MLISKFTTELSTSLWELVMQVRLDVKSLATVLLVCGIVHYTLCQPTVEVPVECSCDPLGSLNCTERGQCNCKPGVTGASCDTCLPNHYSFPSCRPCDCDPDGSVGCDVNGQCVCAPIVEGSRCDVCPDRTIGPSRQTVPRCLYCFCNGFSRDCVSRDNWFQAEVRNTFESEDDSRGFSADGIISASSEGFLDVQARRNGKAIKLSFPAAYLGDKRTAFGQQLSLNLSLPNLSPNKTSASTLQIKSCLGRERPYFLLFPLPELSRDPQYIQIPLVGGGAAKVEKYYYRKPARDRDVIMILSNIRFMRLVVEFEDSNASSNILRLFESQLDFAVDDQSSEMVTDPEEGVNYVEDCTVCPESRMGLHCESCSPGYTTDPTFGGEFAFCVRCFCNFKSESCDPMSGRCFNCSRNTEGADCELCMPGFYRPVTLPTFLECMECDCDINGSVGCSSKTGQCLCADGYTGTRCDDTCDCDSEGSLGVSCDQISGVCQCRESVIGDKCDACEEGSTGTFPRCLECDECATQWQRRIDELRVDVENTLEFVADINVTNTTDEDLNLDEIFTLLRDIQTLLDSSTVDLLSGDVQSLHLRLCTLINDTQDLISRGMVVENQLDALENASEIIRLELDPIMVTLLDLQREFQNLSEIVAGIEPLDATFQLRLAQEVIDRSSQADRLIEVNVTSLLNDTLQTLEEYDFLFTSNDVLDTQTDIQVRLSALNGRLTAIRSFIRGANQMLCGATSDSCNDICGGITCDSCGGENCDSLVTLAEDAESMSAQALEISQSLLDNVLREIEELEEFLSEAETLRNASLQTEVFVSETGARAEVLLNSLQNLISELESELNATRVDPDEIGRIENQTLALELLLNREEFLALLRQINSTIDEIFAQAGVNETDLRRRAMEALARAENANALADAVVANASSLESRLQELQTQQQELEQTANQTQLLVLVAENSINQAEPLLDESEQLLDDTRAAVSSLSARLNALQLQIIENERNLELARNITERAQQLANQTDTDSEQVEGEFNSFSELVFETLSQSERDLLVANELLNRTVTLQDLTQQQLLQVENLDRISAMLFLEQEEIRADISRVANELQRLDREIQVHIARNTVCLDRPSQN